MNIVYNNLLGKDGKPLTIELTDEKAIKLALAAKEFIDNSDHFVPVGDEVAAESGRRVKAALGSKPEGPPNRTVRDSIGLLDMLSAAWKKIDKWLDWKY